MENVLNDSSGSQCARSRVVEESQGREGGLAPALMHLNGRASFSPAEFSFH